MNGDISLSQSLGGLRIANPDDEDDDAVASPTQSTSTAASAHTLTPTNAAAASTSTTTTPAAAYNPASPTPSDDRPTISSHSSGSTIKDLQRTRGLSEISSSGTPHYGHNENGVAPQTAPLDTYGQTRAYRAPSAGSDAISYRQPMSQAPYDTQSQYSQNSQYSNRLRGPPPMAGTGSGVSPGSGPVPGPLAGPGPRPLSLYNHQNISSSSQISSSSYRYRDDILSQPQPMAISRSTSRAAAPGMAMPTRTSSRSLRSDPSMQGPGGVMLPRRSSRRVPPGQTPSAQTSAPCSSYSLENNGPPPSSEEWKEKGAAVATRQELDANGRPVNRIVKKGVNDFAFGRTLGEGSYSTVRAATDRQTNREYAIKVLDKRHIIKEKKVKYVNIEKDALNRLTEHPGIVRLYYTFQDERSLYFVLDLANGGELLGVLKRMGTFDEECTRFYSAQILDSIAYMHSRGIIHRDLKPENVLLDEQMHTKITDFGTAKILDMRRAQDAGAGPGTEGAGDVLDGSESDRAVSFVGTAEYVSPELLTDKNACKASDLWAFGCIVYQLLAGRPPFKAGNEYQTFQKIVALDYSFPDGFPPVARDLIERLLVLDPAQRLPIESIRDHPFFTGIEWGKGLWRQKAPRLRSYAPPTSAPINLNSNGSPAVNTTIPGIPQVMAPSPSHSMQPQQAAPASQAPPQQARPQLRAITELAPPSQLDIDWSPVLTRNNERILKLGNLNVLSAPAPHSPNSKSGEDKETPRKFSRFFGGATTKKRQRLVMITSSARLIIAAAGGDEKKAKLELNLLAGGTSWKSFQDAKGLTAWCVDTREKHLSFEDPRATTSDPDGSKYSTQEWIECIERAKEMAVSHSVANSYSGDSAYNEMLSSTISSPASNSGGDGGMGGEGGGSSHGGRNTLRKEQGDNESLRGKKPRFSKRHSKGGLAAVF